MKRKSQTPAVISKFETPLAVLLIAVAAFLILFHLDRVAFWDDEAHVALFARNLLATHSGTAWDGRNLIPDNNSAWYDANLHNKMPQLDNYVVAASFALLGDSPWAARLPFALCGIGSLLAFWFLLKREFPEFPVLRLYALASTALSVNLLLYSRNCRYYSLSILLTVLIFYVYRRFLETKKVLHPALAGLFAGLLCLNSVLNCACVFGALAARHLFFHRRSLSARDWLNAVVGVAVAAAMGIPYIVTSTLPTMKIVKKYNETILQHQPPWLTSHLTLLWWNLKGVNLINAIPWSIALTLAGFLVWSYRSKKESEPPRLPVAKSTLEFCAAIAGFTLFLSIFSPQFVAYTSFSDVRYFTPILPILAIPVAATLWFIHRFSKIAALGILAVYLTSTVLGYAPGEVAPGWLLPAYWKEISNPYPTGCSEAAAYLNANAAQDDTVWFTPAFMGKPLMYYAGRKIKLRGTMDQRTIMPREAFGKIDSALFIENVFPDWIVAFGAQPDLSPTLQLFSREHIENGETVSCKYQLVKILDVYWGQTQRPELPWHTFGPRTDFNKNGEAVYIFKSDRR